MEHVLQRFPVRTCDAPDCQKRFLPINAKQHYCSAHCRQGDAVKRFRARQRANRPQPPPNKPPTRAKVRKIDQPGQVVMFTTGERQSGKERATAA